MDLRLVEPIRVLSDLHLGHIACVLNGVHEIRPLLEGARTIVFNGDTFELRAHRFKARAAEEQRKLAEMLADLAITPVYLTGNHDPRLTDRHYIDLSAGRVFVTHGDFLFRHISPWSKKLRHCRPAIEAILKEADAIRLKYDFDYAVSITRACCDVLTVMEHSEPRNVMGRLIYILREFWPPTRVAIILHVWLTTPNRLFGALDRYRPESQVVVFGHVHYPGVWEKAGRSAINTGGYLSTLKANVVEIEGDEIRVCPVVRRDGVCHLRRDRLRRITLSLI